jgi:hypothetical protein
LENLMPTIGVDETAAPGMALPQLEAMLGEINMQPVWKDEAQIAAAYYDGKQLSPKVMETLKARGQAPLVFNLIGPTIDAVLGIEAKTRTSWIVRPDNDDSIEVAEAMNEKLNEASRLSLADRACADAYAAQIKTGLGWVEVNRNIDPFDAPYRTNYVSRNEISWDWHSKRPDLKDCRYLVRERWLDEDRALLAFPTHQALIANAVRGWKAWEGVWDDNKSHQMVQLLHAYSDMQQTTLDEETWFDTERRRIRVFEIWYRTYQRGTVLKLNDGRVIEYQPGNPLHNTAIALKTAKPIVGTFPKMRLCYFLGCHRIVDIPSPLPHDSFPYIPLWGFREDGTGIPYGLIRRMMSPQDEVNARRSKMMWLLAAKRVIMDSDATNMDVEEVTDEVQRPDGVIIMNPSRQNRDQYAFRVEQDFQLAAQQFEIMVEAQKMIQDTAGVYSALMGRQDGGADSGVAIASLVEQGSTTLAELNDNYRFGRRLVGEQLMAMIQQDIGKEQTEVATNVAKPDKTKYISLNQPVRDEVTGVESINNDVMRSKMQIVLDDIQATAGYRAQVSNRLFELAATLPDDVKVAILDIVVDSTDIPQREEIVKRIRKITGTGIDPQDMTPEEQAEMQRKQEMAAEQEQLAIEELREKVNNLKSQAIKNNAVATNTDAKTGSQKYDDRLKDAQTDKTIAEMKKLMQEMSAMSEQMNQQITDGQATIKAYESVLPNVMEYKALQSPGATKKPGGMARPVAKKKAAVK